MERARRDHMNKMLHPDMKNIGFAQWWYKLWGTGCTAGTDMVYLLTGTDQVARTDRLLETLENHNLIIRGKLDLTDKSTQAFLSLERSGRSPYRYPREYAWMPNRENPAGLELYLTSKTQVNSHG